MWCTHLEREKLIQDSWVLDSSGDSVDVVVKVQRCGRTLDKWHKEVFGSLQRQSVDKKKELEKFYLEGQLSGNVSKLTTCRRELDILLHREKMAWRQRSKALWIKEVDHNTSFFHSVANSRCRSNHIMKLRDSSSVWQSDPGNLEEIIMEYFNDLFCSTS
ncbi:hypothetical protein REPUB_Repub12eG0062100 [Reevesia pubescens]